MNIRECIAEVAGFNQGIIFWIDEIAGSDDNSGLSSDQAFATERHAISVIMDRIISPGDITFRIGGDEK